MKPFRVCVFTGTRAEYGLLRPVMSLLRGDKDFHLQVLVSGMHLSRKYGATYRQILGDGFKIDARAAMPVGDDSDLGLCNSVSAGLRSISRAYARLKPDAVIILGDRFEALSAAVAAVFLRIPIVHLHGGESTFGLFDEAIRHSITKMSWLHFTSTEIYRRRVIQLGENPGKVFTVGAVGLDNIRTLKFLSKSELSSLLQFSLSGKVAAVTFHPVTLESGSPAAQFSALLTGLDAFPELKIVFTMPNADTGNGEIIALIKDYVRKHPQRAKAFASLGQLRYLSLLKHSDVVVGNSSSGIIEAPSFSIPTVNIGDRQSGRLQGGTVINCAPAAVAIRNALKKALSPAFAAKCRDLKNPYGDGKTSARLVRILKAQLKRGVDLKKVFYDQNGEGRHV